MFQANFSALCWNEESFPARVIDMLKGFTAVGVTLAHFELPKAAVFSCRCHVMQSLLWVPPQYLPPFSQRRGLLQLPAAGGCALGFCAGLGTQTRWIHPLRSESEHSNLNAERSPLLAVPLVPANYYCCFLNVCALVGPHYNVLSFISLDKTIEDIYKMFFVLNEALSPCFKSLGWSGDTSMQVLRTAFRISA